MEPLNNFRKNLKILRKQSGLTQDKLGVILGIRGGTIGDYERGKIIPSIERVLELSVIFDCQLSEFFEEDISRYEENIKNKKIVNTLRVLIDDISKAA